MNNSKFNKCMQIFIYTLRLSAFTFGGGFVIISLMKKQFVDKLKWIDEKEMMDFTAIAQSSPGAIAVNASLLLGYKIAGVAGAFTAILATVIPPLITLSVISYFYTLFIDSTLVKYILMGMQAGVAAVVVDVVFGMTVSIWHDNKWLSIFLSVVSFVCVALLSINVIYIVISFGLLGVATYFAGKGKAKTI